jgi:hypothetical protein
MTSYFVVQIKSLALVAYPHVFPSPGDLKVLKQINWLTLFKEIISVCFKNHTKPINTLCGQNSELRDFVKSGGTYINPSVLKVNRTISKWSVRHFRLQNIR